MANFATSVFYVPPSPLGLVGNRWAVQHTCLTCRQQVATKDLVEHAKAHEADLGQPPGAAAQLPL